LCAAADKEAGCGLKMRKGKCPSDPSYFVFTFTRNPWDRAVSMWSYGLKRRQLEVKNLEERKQMADKYCSFDQFVEGLAKRSPKAGCGHHVQDMQYMSIYNRNGKPGVNFAGRLEFFGRDFKTILARIDPSGKMLDYFNTKGFTMHNDSGHKMYFEYYKNQSMKDAVASFYQADMKLGYSFHTSGEKILPKRWADGKPAGELNYGDTSA